MTIVMTMAAPKKNRSFPTCGASGLSMTVAMANPHVGDCLTISQERWRQNRESADSAQCLPGGSRIATDDMIHGRVGSRHERELLAFSRLSWASLRALTTTWTQWLQSRKATFSWGPDLN